MTQMEKRQLSELRTGPSCSVVPSSCFLFSGARFSKVPVIIPSLEGCFTCAVFNI